MTSEPAIDQDFFGSDSDVFAGADRSQRRLQAGSADESQSRQCRRRGEWPTSPGFGPEKTSVLDAQCVAKFLSFGGSINGNGFRAVLAVCSTRTSRLSRRRGQADDPVRQVLSYFYRAGAD